jgi:uncharacterized protein (DUF305 family)
LRTLAVPAALLATLALGACGSTPATSGASGAGSSPSATSKPKGTPAKEPVKAPDVSFATMMIAQDQQSIQMSDLAVKQAEDAKIKALAPVIKKAVAPELARMSGWFTSVGNVVPDASGAHQMPGMPTPLGRLSAKEMTALGKAKGKAFDQMWLTMMVKHHKGAVTMAKTEVATGSSPDVKQVAQSIIDRHASEIATMSSTLAGH